MIFNQKKPTLLSSTSPNLVDSQYKLQSDCYPTIRGRFFFASPCADGRRRLGCQDLLATIEKIKPKIHAFGHIHEGYGVLEKNSTIFVNAYNIDEHYRMKNPPIVLEI